MAGVAQAVFRRMTEHVVVGSLPKYIRQNRVITIYYNQNRVDHLVTMSIELIRPMEIMCCRKIVSRCTFNMLSGFIINILSANFLTAKLVNNT